MIDGSIKELFVFVIGGFVFLGGINFYNSRSLLQNMQNHSLLLSKDKLILQHDKIKSEVPFTEIKEVIVNLKRDYPKALLLKLTSGHSLKLDNYENMLELKNRIFEHTPDATKNFRKWIHV